MITTVLNIAVWWSHYWMFLSRVKPDLSKHSEKVSAVTNPPRSFVICIIKWPFLVSCSLLNSSSKIKQIQRPSLSFFPQKQIHIFVLIQNQTYFMPSAVLYISVSTHLCCLQVAQNKFQCQAFKFVDNMSSSRFTI